MHLSSTFEAFSRQISILEGTPLEAAAGQLLTSWKREAGGDASALCIEDGQLSTETGESLLRLPWEVQQRLRLALNSELVRRFPPKAPREGSLEELFARGGGWAVGCTAHLDGHTLTLLRTAAKLWWETPEQMTAEVLLHFQWTPRGASSREYSLVCLDSRQNLRWLSDETARPQLEIALHHLTKRLAEEKPVHPSEQQEMQRLFGAFLRPASPDSIVAWCRRKLSERLSGWSMSVEGEAGRHQLSVGELPGLSPTDSPCLLLHTDGEEGRAPSTLHLGKFSPEAYKLAVPEELEADLLLIVERFEEWLRESAPALVDRTGAARQGSFFLLPLLEHRITDGPPPPPPVPAGKSEKVARFRLLRAKKELPAGCPHALALLDAGPYRIVLDDDVKTRPWTCARIGIVQPEGDIIWVLRSDPHSGTIDSLDGDALALRRFLAWLREGLLASGIERALSFRIPRDLRDPNEPAKVTMSLDHWLTFGLPDLGDRFLMDHRYQWYIVAPTPRGTAPQSTTPAVRRYRQFLRDTVDHRFPAPG